jgi:hypothetical protein
MNLPRRGETILVQPYGHAKVERILPNGRVQVTTERIITKKNGYTTNQLIVSLKPLWVVEEVV